MSGALAARVAALAVAAALGPLVAPASPQSPDPVPPAPVELTAPITTFDLDAPLGDPLPLVPLAPGTELDLFGMEQAPGAVDLVDVSGGAVLLDGRAHQVAGAIREVAVRDGRVAPAPWSLTATVSDFTVDGAAGGCSASSGAFTCIPASNLGWRPGAVVAWPTEPVAPAAELPAVVAGAPIASFAAGTGFDTSPQLLCASGDLPANAVYVCAANLSLVVPASAAAGGYRATLTLTLV